MVASVPMEIVVDRLDVRAADMAREQTPETFEELLRRHGMAIFRMAYRLTGNEVDAEDLAQDAMLEAFRAFHKFAPGTHFDRWVHRIMARTFIDSVRWRRRHPTVPLQEPELAPQADQTAQPEDAAWRAEQNTQVHRAVAELPPEFRQAVVLVDLAGLSYEEAAETMHCAVGTVKSRLHRGRSLLRERLQPLLRE